MQTQWALAYGNCLVNAFVHVLCVTLTSACQHHRDQGTSSVFNQMSETYFNPTLAVGQANIPHPLSVDHYRIILKQLKISLLYFLTLNIIYSNIVSDNFKLVSQD